MAAGARTMTETETLFNGRWLRVKRRGSWEYAERVNSGGAVIVVALTGDDELVLVEQYRVPIERRTIEMPAGLVGDEEAFAHEGALETAQRELEEETGYRASRLDFVLTGPTSAGMSSEHVTFVRATGLRKVGPGGGDDSEDIVVHLVPRCECADWIARRAGEGYAIDPKIYAGLYFIERDCHGREWPEEQG